MKVNMTPNPLDVVTIHASQGDTEARQWEFELHNNGELIDTSNITEQMFFKAYKGGTEQILPENTSTPTTSPFKGDIKYPQGLLSDQEFTYRQSPTESDGLAKITDIKGNTLVWNQLASIVGEQTDANGLFDANVYLYSGHKYLMSVEANPSSTNTMYLSVYYNDGSNRQYGQVTGTSSGKYTLIFDCHYTAHGGPANLLSNFWFYVYNVSSWRNLMLFDLTAMGLDSLTDAEILQWFADYYPLPYYDFNAGTLLSFNGTGIKTTNADETEEHTTNLPISTYFPTGMKSAGNVYDELTESKAITRIGMVDLGTLNWSQRLIGTTHIGMQTNGLSATIKNPSTNNDIANIISTAGTASSWTIAMGSDSSSGLMAVSGGYLFIATTETNPTAFKSAMSGVYLYYEMATPTETSFTTASLVTENAEIPLSNNDGTLIGKCTEELSAEPGFHDAKIKLADSDGECYSNKLQLHVERSPQ